MCAIFGIVNHEEASKITYLALHAMQHRGQEGTGISSVDNGSHYNFRRLGLVGDVFQPPVLDSLKGTSAIGHNRYSTTGGNLEINLQPFCMKTCLGWIAIAHNGNLTNSKQLSQELQSQGSIFQSSSDTEIIVHLLAKHGFPFDDSLKKTLHSIQGAYSLLMLNDNKLIAVRDPYGFRPLILGSLNSSIVFASESCAFDLIGAEYIREVQPGELIVVSLENAWCKSYYPFKPIEPARCIFEHIYFARPDSYLFSSWSYDVRKAIGAKLAQESFVDCDMIMPIPDSGVPAAIGYSQQCKLPFEMGLIRSHYTGRSFIQPEQHVRDFEVKLKLNAVKNLSGKRITVIDDSLVRGTTSKKIIQMIRDANAKEVHLRISAPPTTNPCMYGIDTPTKEELLASNRDVEEIRNFIGADSLAYLSLGGLMETVKKFSGNGYCHACFSGKYPC